jgi:hypothetical protein
VNGPTENERLIEESRNGSTAMLTFVVCATLVLSLAIWRCGPGMVAEVRCEGACATDAGTP